MSADDNLPVILVSAVDAATASEIISELVEVGSSPPQCNGVGGHGSSDEPAAPAAAGRVWELHNKYYSAAVRLLPLADGAAPDPNLDVQAHIIYLTEDEISDDTACIGRAAAARASRGCVRLVAARAAREPPAPAAWARAQRYELVPLLAPPAAPADHDVIPETYGAARVREALHAHAWPGLRRAGAPHRPPPNDLGSDAESSAESSDESWGAWVGAEAEADEEAGAVERAQRFADALALLPARRRLDAAGGDAARRLQAEQLVVAFCRALGHELHLDTPGGDGGAGSGGGDGGAGGGGGQ